MISNPNFSNYNLYDMPQGGVYELGDGVIPEMAQAFDVELSETPDDASLKVLVGAVGPAKFLQDNIGLVQERLGRGDDAVAIAADWVDRSGVLKPFERSFATPELAVPEQVDVAIITGGVARWMTRRKLGLERYVDNGGRVGQVVLAAGQRAMREFAGTPTEAQFMEDFVAPSLRELGMDVEVIAVNSTKGNEVAAEAAVAAGLTDGKTLVVANAPSAIQTAGELRAAGRALAPRYDEHGDQLFVVADSIKVARAGEGPETHQNPYTALGQIARNALQLHRQSV